MTVLSQLTTSLEWGAVFIFDPMPSGDFPEWADKRQILGTPGFVAVPAMHLVDGDVTITITDDPDGLISGIVYRGMLEVPSRIVFIGDANGALAALACRDTRVALAIGTNRQSFPDRITVAVQGGVLTDPPADSWVRFTRP